MDIYWRNEVAADFAGYALKELRGDDCGRRGCALRGSSSDPSRGLTGQRALHPLGNELP
jgi:hypothetical protein